MSIELKTVMGQMNIVNGRWVSQAPNTLAVREPTGRLRGGPPKGDLFITLELRGDYEDSEREKLYQSLAETIRNTYYQSPGSITASLRLALLAANESLLAEHARRPLAEPATAERGSRAGKSSLLGGVAAVVVRGEDVFIASVGPAVTYSIIRGLVTQYPEASPWLDMAEPQATGAPALGRWAGLDVQLFHMQVEPGDMLILGDSRFAACTSPDQVERTAAYQGIEGALTNLGKLVARHDCTALVVEIQAKSEDAISEQIKKGIPATSSLPRQALASQTASTPLPPVGVMQAGRRETATPTAEEEAVPPRVSLPRIQIPVGRWLITVGKGILALVMVVSTGLRTLVGRVLPGREQGVSARHAPAAGQAHRVRSSPFPPHMLRTIAFAFPILVLLVAVLAYWQRGVARENEFNNLMEQAQAAYQQALGADDASSRELLARTGTLLAQAEAIKPNEPIISDLRASIAERLDKIGRVERLYWVGQLRSYTDPGTQLRRVIVNGLSVYVLDTGTDQVYRHQLDEVSDALEPDESDPVLARRGQQVDTSVVGEMIDLVWMPAGGNRQTSDLLILESGGLLEYNPSWGLTAVPIAGVETWITPVSVGAYFGNFYILDPQAGQILRYLPTTEDYTMPAENYFPAQTTTSLTGAVDMAIDGFVYVLYLDGSIRKFEGGVPAAFEITDIDTPLNRPAAIYTAPDDVAQYLYVADAGNRRVVQLNKDGRFVRQFKPRDEDAVDFSTLRSIFVDELAGKLYVVNDRTLYIANVTPLQ